VCIAQLVTGPCIKPVNTPYNLSTVRDGGAVVLLRGYPIYSYTVSYTLPYLSVYSACPWVPRSLHQTHILQRIDITRHRDVTLLFK
jgi:hypothetical protein